MPASSTFAPAGEPRDGPLERAGNAVRRVRCSSTAAWPLASLERMADDATARLTGGAFSNITVPTRRPLDLERRPPRAIPAAANDDPADASVARDRGRQPAMPDGASASVGGDRTAAAMPRDRRT